MIGHTRTLMGHPHLLRSVDQQGMHMPKIVRLFILDRGFFLAKYVLLLKLYWLTKYF